MAADWLEISETFGNFRKLSKVRSMELSGTFGSFRKLSKERSEERSKERSEECSEERSKERSMEISETFGSFSEKNGGKEKTLENLRHCQQANED